MSTNKKSVRAAFRISVFVRDKYCCRCCNKAGKDRQGGDTWKKFHPNIKDETTLVELDAHHIQNRNTFKNGGYIANNGISVCDDCHIKAEAFWSTGKAVDGFAPDDLYRLIGSSKEKAIEADSKLG